MITDTVLQEALTLLERMAQAIWRRQHRRYPLAEYRSAGNGAIAEVWQRYGETAPEDFLPRLKFYLMVRLRDVRRREAGTANLPDRNAGPALPRVVVTVVSAERLGRLLAYGHTLSAYGVHGQEIAVYAHEVLAYLETRYGAKDVAAFVKLVEGYTEAEVAALVGTTPYAIGLLVDRIRTTARKWMS